MDFDLRRSIHAPPGQSSVQDDCTGGQVYLLRPTLRLVNNAEVGAIAGQVDPQLIADKCPANEYGAVYVFAVPAGQTVAQIDDVDGSNDPLTSALVKLDANSNYSYRAAFLPSGNYTVAYTCDAVSDQPDADDAVVFVPVDGKTVAVQNNLITTVNFAVDDLQ